MPRQRIGDTRRFGLVTLPLLFLMTAGPRAEAQDRGWSIGLALTGGSARPEDALEVEIAGLGLIGRWQHRSTGWGAMAEIRRGEDDETLVEFDQGQLNLYATYTWRRQKLVRPFVKLGISSTEVEVAGGRSDDDTAGILGGGVEVGRGRWAFHFSIDDTEPRIDVLDPQDKTLFGTYTLGAVYRF